MDVDAKWKEKDKRYLKELQTFLDKVENIKEDDLRREIIGQVLKLDKVLTEIATEEINRNK